MSEAFLVMEGLSKSFNGLKAVDGVSLMAYRGEIFGLLGPNGSGKTTIIRLASTLLKPDSGEITIGGHSVRHEAEAVRSLIGICPQELALYEELSALDNLVFFGRMTGLDSREARIQAMAHLELVGLTERAKGRVGKFSGGMKRRLNFAVSLMGHPQILFLDEPTLGIDLRSRSVIYEAVEALRANGMTIVLTSHYMDEAERLCDRVAIMDVGRVVAVDAPRALRSQIGPPDQVTLVDVFLRLTGQGARD